MAILFGLNNASSFRPGGVNTAFCDGSVRFIKDTISSWPTTITPSNFQSAVLPVGSQPIPAGASGYSYGFSPSGTTPWNWGVWQKLSTRNGGEVISSDQY